MVRCDASTAMLLKRGSLQTGGAVLLPRPDGDAALQHVVRCSPAIAGVPLQTWLSHIADCPQRWRCCKWRGTGNRSPALASASAIACPYPATGGAHPQLPRQPSFVWPVHESMVTCLALSETWPRRAARSESSTTLTGTGSPKSPIPPQPAAV
ncbi:hypothetical protein CFC21_001205 [Triticum aestivum]|uniref:Uncharacterized protein n=2 Tax=Triticum TaxID=4564 RepID=A0A3B5XWB1_WHEAT|nr:hypothetical protein TRIUR3_24973 [Triticum urartu]KAF6982877.1 hypothetical protein CFC21_001205 [Triticum aestivum]